MHDEIAGRKAKCEGKIFGMKLQTPSEHVRNKNDGFIFTLDSTDESGKTDAGGLSKFRIS